MAAAVEAATGGTAVGGAALEGPAKRAPLPLPRQNFHFLRPLLALPLTVPVLNPHLLKISSCTIDKRLTILLTLGLWCIRAEDLESTTMTFSSASISMKSYVVRYIIR